MMPGGMAIRHKRRRGVLLGFVSGARRSARSDDEYQQCRPDDGDCREDDHGSMFVRLIMSADCGPHQGESCYRPVSFWPRLGGCS